MARGLHGHTHGHHGRSDVAAGEVHGVHQDALTVLVTVAGVRGVVVGVEAGRRELAEQEAGKRLLAVGIAAVRDVTHA